MLKGRFCTLVFLAQDLRDLLNKSPRNALDGQPVRFDSASGLNSRRIPRLPHLNEVRDVSLARLGSALLVLEY